jgi:ammonium transporter, Amt family
VPFVMLGTALLWFGWFGFNAGSAIGSNGLAALAFVNTQVATASAFIAWLMLEIIYFRGKATAVGACTGAVVGLVAVTPAAGYIKPMASIALGIFAAVAVFFAVELKKKVRFLSNHLDDTLDVSYYCRRQQVCCTRSRRSRPIDHAHA